KCEVLIKCRIEEGQLFVCPNCAKMGEIIKEEPKKKEPFVFEEKEEKIKPDENLLNELEKDKFADDFYFVIRKKRQQQGLTIKELANKLNIKESIMKKIEQGNFMPDNSTKNKLERFFGIKLTAEEETEIDI
ncbi:MAG: multiprotein-bridging factor 1 family protein, partial [Candidatus Aenigmarchaeota archaeon]|nr:multiprotein-bridging factor 1 family protein [Candidatus Aenigmarchaeota archaeon]